MNRPSPFSFSSIPVRPSHLFHRSFKVFNKVLLCGSGRQSNFFHSSSLSPTLVSETHFFLDTLYACDERHAPPFSPHFLRSDSFHNEGGGRIFFPLLGQEDAIFTALRTV